MTSRRLRFEILRRDDYACRYCGEIGTRQELARRLIEDEAV